MLAAAVTAGTPPTWKPGSRTRSCRPRGKTGGSLTPGVPDVTSCSVTGARCPIRGPGGLCRRLEAAVPQVSSPFSPCPVRPVLGSQGLPGRGRRPVRTQAPGVGGTGRSQGPAGVPTGLVDVFLVVTRGFAHGWCGHVVRVDGHRDVGRGPWLRCAVGPAPGREPPLPGTLWPGGAHPAAHPWVGTAPPSGRASASRT